jgi:predicted permease
MSSISKNWTAGLTRRDRRNLRPLNMVAPLWGLSVAAAAVFLPRGDGSIEAQPLWGWVLTAVAIAMSGLLAFFYLRFVRGLDELWRRVHMEAMAAAFGVGVVWGLAAYLLAQMGVRNVEELTWVLMIVAYSVRRMLGIRTILHDGGGDQ